MTPSLEGQPQVGRSIVRQQHNGLVTMGFTYTCDCLAPYFEPHEAKVKWPNWYRTNSSHGMRPLQQVGKQATDAFVALGGNFYKNGRGRYHSLGRSLDLHPHGIHLVTFVLFFDTQGFPLAQSIFAKNSSSGDRSAGSGGSPVGLGHRATVCGRGECGDF